jgi:iron complex transport system substrate-binding protein
VRRAWLLALALVTTTPAAAAPQRVVSINLCTDQLVLALADPAQIAGLSPYAGDERSFFADRARRFPHLTGEAEDTLALQPDLVLTGSFGKRETREMLARSGVTLLTLPPALSVADTLAQIRQVGAALGQGARAEAAVARITDALDRARAAARGKPWRVLGVARRGWITGADSLTSSLLAEIGLRNAAGELGLTYGGFASLETILAAQPDLILQEERTTMAEDQGQAFLLHPALAARYPPQKRLLLPEKLITCGGPMLAEAIEVLQRELARVQP